MYLSGFTVLTYHNFQENARTVKTVKTDLIKFLGCENTTSLYLVLTDTRFCNLNSCFRKNSTKSRIGRINRIQTIEL